MKENFQIYSPERHFWRQQTLKLQKKSLTARRERNKETVRQMREREPNRIQRERKRDLRPTVKREGGVLGVSPNDFQISVLSGDLLPS